MTSGDLQIRLLGRFGASVAGVPVVFPTRKAAAEKFTPRSIFSPHALRCTPVAAQALTQSDTSNTYL